MSARGFGLRARLVFLFIFIGLSMLFVNLLENTETKEFMENCLKKYDQVDCKIMNDTGKSKMNFVPVVIPM